MFAMLPQRERHVTLKLAASAPIERSAYDATPPEGRSEGPARVTTASPLKAGRSHWRHAPNDVLAIFVDVGEAPLGT